MLSDEQKNTGLYRKFNVTRVSDPDGKHVDCKYFVIDLNHDKYAVPALRAYAQACYSDLPELAIDLLRTIERIERNEERPKGLGDDSSAEGAGMLANRD